MKKKIKFYQSLIVVLNNFFLFSYKIINSKIFQTGNNVFKFIIFRTWNTSFLHRLPKRCSVLQIGTRFTTLANPVVNDVMPYYNAQL